MIGFMMIYFLNNFIILLEIYIFAVQITNWGDLGAHLDEYSVKSSFLAGQGSANNGFGPIP